MQFGVLIVDKKRHRQWSMFAAASAHQSASGTVVAAGKSGGRVFFGAGVYEGEEEDGESDSGAVVCVRARRRAAL